MAAHPIDLVILSDAASLLTVSNTNETLRRALHELIGLSQMLIPALNEARRLLKSQDTITREHHNLCDISVWYTVQTLDILERFLEPNFREYKFGIEVKILAAKIEASCYHILYIFREDKGQYQQKLKKSMELGLIRSSPGRKRASYNVGPPRVSTTLLTSKQEQRFSLGSLPTPFREEIDQYWAQRKQGLTSGSSIDTNPWGETQQSRQSQQSPESGEIPVMAINSSTPMRRRLPTLEDPRRFLLPAQELGYKTEIVLVRCCIDALRHLAPYNLVRLLVMLEYAAFLKEIGHIKDCYVLATWAEDQAWTTEANEHLANSRFSDVLQLVKTLGNLSRRTGDQLRQPPRRKIQLDTAWFEKRLNFAQEHAPPGFRPGLLDLLNPVSATRKETTQEPAKKSPRSRAASQPDSKAASSSRSGSGSKYKSKEGKQLRREKPSEYRGNESPKQWPIERALPDYSTPTAAIRDKPTPRPPTSREQSRPKNSHRHPPPQSYLDHSSML